MTTKTTRTRWEHPQYIATSPAVVRMRDSVAGEDVVKSKGVLYQPNPCTDPKEQETDEQIQRYSNYLLFSEYDNIPGNTLETLIGAMFRVPVVIDLDGLDEELLTDADGNGAGLAQSIELTSSECLQMRYEGLLAEFSDLAGQDPTEITVQESKDRGLRSTIKHYTREAIVNWSYKVINGTKQLNFLVLLESELQVFDVNVTSSEGFAHDIVRSYLVLALDADGDYVQRRFISSGKPGKDGTWSDPIYPEAAGKQLNFIPFEIVYSSERQIGDVPRQLGYIDPISAKAIHRYQVSALLKEALRITAQPTSFTKGWTDQAAQIYEKWTGKKEINLGAGAHLFLPKEVEAGFIEWNADSNALFKYMEENKKQIIAHGGVFNEDSDSAGTATAASINSAEKKGVLSTLAKNIEESYGRVLGWVALFNGTENSEPSVKLTREFTAITLSAQDRAAILQEVREMVITRHEALRQLERGGVLTVTAEALLDELETNGEGLTE